MKKIFFLIVFSFFFFYAIRADVSCSLSDDGTLTISGTDMPNYNVGYNGNAPWHSQREEIKKIVIKKGVTNIGDYAFFDCVNLKSITIPNTVTSIGKYAFESCLSFTTISIPNSVTSIGIEAFAYCKSLSSITIPNSVTSIGYWTFYECSALTSISIPNSVTTIGECAFANCYSLTSVTIGNSVTSIDKYAFKYCFNIRELYSWNILPPKCTPGYNPFENMNTKHVKVFVPEGTADAYKYSEGWYNLVNFYEMEYSPVLSEVEPITVSDGSPTVKKGYYKENTLTYLREGAAISKDNYASFCLPFAVDPSDAQFKAVYVPVGIALYNTETNTLRIGFYKSNEIIPTGTPFLAKLAVDDKVEIKNALPVNYDSNEPAVKAKVIRTFDFYEHSGIMSENDNYSINFTGTYKKISPANACTFNIDGSAGPSANVFPFRAYVALTKNNTNAKIIASFDEDAETTGIKELLISNDKSPVYDLNGRVVNENTQKSGIYIKDGKKYVK